MEARELTINDYNEVYALWHSCQGIGLHSDADNEYALRMYLSCNTGSSFVALERGKIVGAVLCGHDGRRGYLHHLSVCAEQRRKGIATALVERAIDCLRQKGIRKCNGFVFADNLNALQFWQTLGWATRDDLKVVSKTIIL